MPLACLAPRRCLHVEEAFCRDVRPEDLAGVAGALGDWLAAASGVLQARAGGAEGGKGVRPGC